MVHQQLLLGPDDICGHRQTCVRQRAEAQLAGCSHALLSASCLWLLLTIAEVSSGHTAHRARNIYPPALSRKGLLIPALDGKHLKGRVEALVCQHLVFLPPCLCSLPFLSPCRGGPSVPPRPVLWVGYAVSPIITPVPWGSAAELGHLTRSKSWESQVSLTSPRTWT